MTPQESCADAKLQVTCDLEGQSCHFEVLLKAYSTKYETGVESSLYWKEDIHLSTIQYYS